MTEAPAGFERLFPTGPLVSGSCRMRLPQVVAIVSGAARGIGAAEARALVHAGARLSDREQDEVGATKAVSHRA